MPLNLDKIDLGSFGINEKDQQQTQLNANVTEAVKINPDQHARITNLSKQSGVPEFAIESNPEEIEQQLKLDQIDLDSLQQRAPGTADFVGRDFNNAVIAQEDIATGVLEGIEETFRGLGESIQIGFKTQIKGAELASADRAPDRIQDLIPMSALPIGMESFAPVLSQEFAANFGIETDEQLTQAKEEAAERLIGEIQQLQEQRKLLTPEDLNIVQEGIRAGVESLANMVPGAGLMLLSGGRAAPLLVTMGAQTFAGSYADARAEGLTTEESTWFASIDAAIEVGTELLPTGTIERVLTGKSTGLKKDALKFVVQEMGTEQLATALQTINSFAFGLDEELENATTVEEMVDIQLRRQAVTAIATVVAGGTQIAAATTVRKTVEKLTNTENQKQNQAEVEQRSIDQLNANAEQSKLKERDIESFKQFVREADGENDTHVFIDAVQTSLYLQSKTRDEIEADPALKTLDNAMRESRTTGADVAIPVDDFTGDIAGTETFTQLREHMTMSEETVSPFRQEQYQQETQDYVRTLLDEANENVSEYVEAQEIYTKVRDQLIDTGAVNAQNASIMAQVVPAWATAQARRTGKSVAQVYEETGLVIEGPQTGELERLEGEQILAQPTQTVEEIETSLTEEFDDLKLSLSDRGDKVTLNKIIVPEGQRGQGTGSQVMQRVIDWADQNGKTVALTPGKDFGGTVSRLKSFYKQFGFVENKGRNKDFEISESMYREPQQPEVLRQEPVTTGDGVLGSIYETGKPADLFFIRNTEAAPVTPPPGMDFGQDIEPAGEYMVVDESDLSGNVTPGWVAGQISFKNPIVLEHKNTRSTGWKKDLSEMFDGKTGGELTEAIRQAGHDGILTIEEAIRDGSPNLSEAVNISGDKTVTSREQLEQRTKTNGEPEARGYYDPANSIIRLTEAADLSTFLHEFAHFMYEMEVTGDTELLQSINGWYKRNASEVAIEAGEYAPNTTIIPRHVVAFLDEGTAGDKERDVAIRRAVHEQFARGFETYLMEGKSPSIELRNAFRTFARWLAQIYQRLRGDLKVNLDNEMRQVFDRLLATEEQLAAAEARARVEPFFTDAAMAGMTEKQFADYQTRQEKVKDVQSETLRDKLIKQLTRQTKAWWKEEKQDIIDEEMDRLRTEPVHAARVRLKDGDIKLDHATVKEMIGEERTDKLGRKSTRVPDQLRGMTAKGQEGVHPDEAAAFFGYNSGSEMLNDLVTAPKIETVADANAEARMIERHGDILTDGTIEQQADEAVQSEERGRLILHELKMVARGTNQRAIERETIKDIAAERIGQLSFREIHPGKYRKAEIQAAQEAARMLAEGNREGAAQAKQRQVVNYYMGLEATNAKNEITKIVDRMSRYNKKKVREEIQKAEGGYWDQIVKILERFEFRKSATLASVDQVNQDINTWARERIDIDGDGLVLHNAVLNESYVTHWKNVAYSDMQGINDSVKNIEHVARYANKLTRMGEEIEFNKLVDRWVTNMNESVKTRFKSKRTDVVEGKKWGRWLMAQMSKVPWMASWLDGGERVGISHQVMVQPFTDAYETEINTWKDVAAPVMDAIENRSKEDKKRHNRKIFIPEINDHLYGHQVIAVALNTGNQSNLRKLLLGEGWADPENDADITFQNTNLQAVLKHMTASDWQMVQLIWDRMEMLYPQLAEVHRRTTGLVPPKVEATPVETEFGTFKGGYYPVKYDPNRSLRAAQNEDKLNAETESMFSNNASIQASVNTGATNERTGFYDAIRLSLDVVPAHFQETIHYITHHDPVREVNRLIRDARVAETIKEKLGPEEYAQLRPWLNDVAKDGRETPTKMFWDDMLQRLRFGVTLGAMGFKASTGIIQISGLSNTIAEVGMNNTMKGVRAVLGSTTTMKQAWEFAAENSKVMKHRAQTMDREIKNAMKRIEGKRGIMAAVQEASMKHIALIQTYMVDLPSWHSAYSKGMSEWGDEQRAFQYADWVVEQVQGSGATKDLARIMRNQSETGRMFTMFMTFFSSLWNMERDLVKGAKSGLYSTTNVAAKMMFLFTIPVLFEMLMRGEFSTEDDDDETAAQKMLTGVAMYPIQSVPFIRDVANAVGGEFGYNISPMQQIMEQGVRTIPEVVERGFTDEEITKGQIKGATKFIGAALGVPGTGQAWVTGEHLHEVLTEGEDFTLHQFLFGPDRN